VRSIFWWLAVVAAAESAEHQAVEEPVVLSTKVVIAFLQRELTL
jgi:hypothetical protein